MVINQELINEALEAIFPLPKEFGLLEHYDEEAEPINLPFLTNVLFEVDPSILIYYGASKMVIVSPKFGDVVVKIPFNGMYSEDEDGCISWDPFIWAPAADSSDYCLAEYEKYHRLKTYGLSCFVAKIYHYKTIDGVRVFLQEWVTPKEDMCSINKPSQRSQEIARAWYKEDKFYTDPEWIANCIDCYGESKVKRFLYYCSNIDLDILEDISSSNYGYRENDTPAILDYSNFLS